MSRVQSGLRWSRTPERCSSIRRPPPRGRNRPCRAQRSGPESDSSSNRPPSGPRSQRATGIPKPFLGRLQDRRGQAVPPRPASGTAWFRPLAVFVRRRQPLRSDVDQGRRRGTGRGPPGRTPCSRGRPSPGCPRAGTCPDRVASERASGSPPGQEPGATSGARPRRRSLRAGRPARSGRSPRPRTTRASADAPGPSARRPPEELLELEVEADVAVVDRQPTDRRARQRSGRARQAAKSRAAPRPRTWGSRPAARRRRRRPGRPSPPRERTG